MDERQASFPALGSTALVAVTAPAALAPARAAVEQIVDRFDRACSRFRDDSELMKVNEAAGSPVAASELLLDAVEEALRAAQVTEGDVDPTVGEALIALGYDRDFDAISSSGTALAAPRIAAAPGWRTVQVDRDAGTVRVPSGVTLDLGATAKALACDRAARAAAEAAGCGVLVALGGDVSVAGTAPPEGWPVRVTDDHRAAHSAPGQWIALGSGGLATSSTTVRRWRTAGGEAHHVLDPATGSPATGAWRTASVTAATCLDANIASTAALVRGERAAAWLQSLELPSRLVGVDGSVVHLAGWPAEGDDLPEREGLAP